MYKKLPNKPLAVFVMGLFITLAVMYMFDVRGLVFAATTFLFSYLLGELCARTYSYVVVTPKEIHLLRTPELTEEKAREIMED